MNTVHLKTVTHIIRSIFWHQCYYVAVSLNHTYIVLHHEVRLHAIQASVIETGFKTNQVINDLIHWELKENGHFSVLIERRVMFVPEDLYCPNLNTQK